MQRFNEVLLPFMKENGTGKLSFVLCKLPDISFKGATEKSAISNPGNEFDF